MKDVNVAIIGGTGDIGFNLTKQFASMGANVFAIGRNESRLKELEGLGENVKARKFDPTNPEEMDDLVKLARPKILITSVGSWTEINVESSIDEFVHQLDLDLEAFVKAALVPMFVFNKYFNKNTGGLIVDISSHAAEGFLPGNLTYAPTKTAVKVFTENLDVENGSGQKVTILRAISQLVDTPKNRAAHPEISKEQWATAVQIADIANWIANSYRDPLNADDKFFKSGIIL